MKKISLRKIIYYSIVFASLLSAGIAYLIDSTERGQTITGLLLGLVFIVTFFKREFFNIMQDWGVPDGKAH